MPTRFEAARAIFAEIQKRVLQVLPNKWHAPVRDKHVHLVDHQIEFGREQS